MLKFSRFGPILRAVAPRPSAASGRSLHLRDPRIGELVGAGCAFEVSGQRRLVAFGEHRVNGQVDGGDYSKTDNGFNERLASWTDGDFNYDGSVDGADYALIDNAFINQASHGGPLSIVAAPTTAAMLITQPGIAEGRSAFAPPRPTPSAAAVQSQHTPSQLWPAASATDADALRWFFGSEER